MFFVIPTHEVFLNKHLNYKQIWQQKEKKQKWVNCQNISTSKNKPLTSNRTPDHNQDTQSALHNLALNTTAWDSCRNVTIQDNNKKDALKF